MSAPSLSFVMPRDKLSDETRGRLGLGVRALRVSDEWARQENPSYWAESRAALQQRGIQK